MRAKTKRFIPVITGVGASVLIVLTGCSAGTAAGDGVPAGYAEGVYELQTPRYGSDSGELTIRLPEGLVEAIHADGGEVLVSEMRLTSRHLESSKYCAFDAEISYTGNAHETLTEPRWTEAEWKELSELGFLRDATPMVIDQLEGMGQDRGQIYAETDDDGYVTMKQFDQALAGGGQISEELQYWKDDYLDYTYEPSPVWGTLQDATPVEDLEVNNPDPGVYFSSDYEALTFVERCATSPSDEGDAELQFPVLLDGKVKELADIELSIMKSGTISINTEIDHFVRDTDGNWLLR